MARQALDIPEGHVLGAAEVLDRLLQAGPGFVLFVDDFVGSGDQFVRTWRRPYDLSTGNSTSFESLARTGRGDRFYYCPLVCTTKGHARIQRACPEVQLRPVHLLPPQYSALAQHSVLWPSHSASAGRRLIRAASLRAGISEGEWKGYANLGLALAFEHSVPDATLPLFYWEKNGWQPLLRRR
jgi:hypothetical protein